MRTLFTLIIVLVSGLLGFFLGVHSVAQSSTLVVSPIDTSPGQLRTSMTIAEDQNISDEKSSIILQFSTLDYPGTNSVNFAHGETVTCANAGSRAMVYDASTSAYLNRVGPMADITKYSCTYHYQGDKKADIDIPKGTPLLPEYLSNGNATFKIKYRPDTDPQLFQQCTVAVNAKDSSQTLSGPPLSESVSGDYTTSTIDTSGLSGQGTIVLTRMCTFTFTPPQTDFSSYFVTYKSIAALPITWSPPSG